jgi:hypothetical protein
LPARFRGVGFFNAVLVCAADGTFFDAALVFFSATLVGSADGALFDGFVSIVVILTVLGWWLTLLTDR